MKFAETDLARGMRRNAAVSILAGIMLCGHEASASSPPASDALIYDIERIVAAEATGWLVDAFAYETMRPTLMASLCRVPTTARVEALRKLRERALAAGDPLSVYERGGRQLTAAMEEALRASRELGALESALSYQSSCPFWLEPAANFESRQTVNDRLTLSFESGGIAQARRTDGFWAIGGGGYARLLAGYGLGRRFSLLSGYEFGGGAIIQKSNQERDFAINYLSAIPVVFRSHWLLWQHDVELAPTALFQANNSRLSYGVRAGTTLGVAALRTQGILPWAGVSVAYEYHFPGGGRSQASFIRGGVRVGGVWDP